MLPWIGRRLRAFFPDATWFQWTQRHGEMACQVAPRGAIFWPRLDEWGKGCWCDKGGFCCKGWFSQPSNLGAGWRLQSRAVGISWRATWKWRGGHVDSYHLRSYPLSAFQYLPVRLILWFCQPKMLVPQGRRTHTHSLSARSPWIEPPKWPSSGCTFSSSWSFCSCHPPRGLFVLV